MLTKNQISALLLHYIMSQKKKKVFYQKIASCLKRFTLTGFKYIAEKLEEYRRKDTKTFQWGMKKAMVT